PARLHVHGWCVAAVLAGAPPREGRTVVADVLAQRVSRDGARAAGHLPAVTDPAPDLLHVRGRADADRAWLRDAVPAGLDETQGAMDQRGTHPRWILGGICVVS